MTRNLSLWIVFLSSAFLAIAALSSHSYLKNLWPATEALPGNKEERFAGVPALTASGEIVFDTTIAKHHASCEEFVP